jgi:GNAT superfamily N-acetyltransferase
LLVDGFEHPPMILTGHNPPYYERLLHECGFAKVRDFYAWWIGQTERAAQRLRRFAARLGGREVATIREINLKRIGEEGQRIRRIYNEAWQNNWGYVPFSEKEFDFMAHELKPLVDSKLVLVAEVGGEPAGFILTVPDINAAIRHANGRLTRFGLPIGLAKLLYHKRRLKTARLVALGVVPKYRRHGVAELLVLRIIEEGMLKKGLVGECSLVLEDNVMMNRFLAAIGAERYKTYRIYSRAIDE